jgi:methionyl-tRNA synthetase
MEIKPSIHFDDFAKIDLRVATIVEAEAHPNADKLLKLKIDLGSEQRQICAGIRAYYDPAALVGRQIVVVANLEPRKMRGEISQGMLLAASHEEPAPSGEEGQEQRPALRNVVLLQPDQQLPPGSAIH